MTGLWARTLTLTLHASFRRHCKVCGHKLLAAVGTPALAVRQATVHREWIVDEATVQQRQAEPDPPPDPDPDAPPHVYTTVAREMAKLGAPWLNVLKVRRHPARTLTPDLILIWGFYETACRCPVQQCADQTAAHHHQVAGKHPGGGELVLAA